MKRIAVLGSTGSVGQNTLRVAEHLKDSVQVTALAVHSNIELLADQIQTFHPEIVCVFEEKQAKKLQALFPSLNVVSGEEGLVAISSYEAVDFVVIAMVGMPGLVPTLTAIQSGKGIGLANKEVLISGGELIGKLVKKHHVSLIPIDSEHSAIFQCLQGKNKHEVNRIILTASGGPFRSHSFDQLSSVTLEEALNHPTWNMGAKITVDSSTLMNKGLEMIEAHWLFDLPPEKIEVVIHPQSIIHSMVEWIDGTILAEMSEPSMVYPIQYALTYPKREKGLFPPFDFIKNSCLEFSTPDDQKFPSLRLARDALAAGNSFPCYLNAANEVLVSRFLNREISWMDIVGKLQKLLDRHQGAAASSVEEILSVDREARQKALKA
ncbi:MAG: 1-deoxy-D-xylulose-5-phosphate reductoisomerase [Chlamydiales bacterium]